MTTQQVWTQLWSLGSWSWPVAIGLVGAYAWSVGWPKTRKVPRRAGFFLAGVAVMVLALVSPINTLADGYLFSAHMAQHLVLLLLVPPLLLLGLPVRKESRFVDALLAKPVMTWLAGIGVMWFWHIPSICAASLHSPLIRNIQFTSLVLAGSAFLWPIFSPNVKRRLDPARSIAYLVVGCMGCTALGIWITFSPVSVCPGFFNMGDTTGLLSLMRGGWGLSPATDQQLAGLLMWVPACLCYLSGVLLVVARWYQPTSEGAHVA